MKSIFLTLCIVLSFQLLSAQTKKSVHHKVVSKTTVSPALKASIDAGKVIYTQNCLTCHQADGYGVQNMNPPLIKTSYVLGDKTRLIGILLNGLSHQEIDGNPYQNVMPSQSFLTDKQMADVLTYVRNSFGNKASAITEAEVKTIKAKK